MMITNRPRYSATMVLVLTLVLALTSGVAALIESWGEVSDGDDSIELKVDFDSNVFILFVSDEHVINTQYIEADLNEMKKFRVAYKNAKAKAKTLRKGQQDVFQTLTMRGAIVTFAGAVIGGDQALMLMFKGTDSVDENTFLIYVNKPSPYPVRAKFEKLLEMTNQ